MKNMFCTKASLSNEASVEQFFVNRLLTHLGYSDDRILPKTSIKKAAIARGSQKLNYKPDYILCDAKGKPRWIVDAKAANEDISDWVEQCASYCLYLNRQLSKGDGVRYFLLTNGMETKVWEWDGADPTLSLSFSDFSKGNKNLIVLESLLAASNVDDWRSGDAQDTFIFERPTPASINATFATCNNYIYKHDNISPSAAFHEFVKVIFLKIRADRELHRKFPKEMQQGLPVPVAAVSFSQHWIESLEQQNGHPLDVQFQQLLESLEKEVVAGSKKRIFDQAERLNLQPDTAKAVVKMLEHQDLFGIDEDLNGRLFETFLNSTMRGRELGQYFTPRSIVKLMAKLADIRVTRDHVDTVIDPCCGTGGFLIEAMAQMTQRVSGNSSFSGSDRDRLFKTICENSLFGVDVGREPPIARIARINMYLHGDGGSRIYIAEALDKAFQNQGFLSAELEAQVREFHSYLKKTDGFDVVLTNPPFAKEYDPKVKSNKRLLDQYEMPKIAKINGAVRSNALFFERYADLLRPGGRVLAVVDDSLLGGKKYDWVRDYIRKQFIVRAVISLPGDAFQRSGARVKTSIIYLNKRVSADERQPEIFMWYCTAIGVDDSARQRASADDAIKRQEAKREIEQIVAAFHASQTGVKTHLVSADAIADRLDVKSCVLKPGRKIRAWKKLGVDVESLGTWVDYREDESDANPEDIVKLLSVRYDGYPDEPQEIAREIIKYPTLYRARAGDIVVSHINAVNGAICVVPEGLDDVVVSPEYSVLTPKKEVNPYALWAILRSPEIRADLIVRSTGLGRARIDQKILLSLPIPAPTASGVNKVADRFKEVLMLEAKAKKMREDAQKEFEEKLELASEAAEDIILAFKPPR